MMIRALAVAAMMSGALAAPAAASPGDLDTGFGNDSPTDGFFNCAISQHLSAEAVAVQPLDGKIVVAGSASIPNGLSTTNAIVVLRLNTDGTLDTGFGNTQACGGTGTQKGLDVFYINNGLPASSGGGAGVYGGADIALQPDGQILVAGFGRDHGVTQQDSMAVLRLNRSNGSLDTSFGKVDPSTGNPSGVATVVVGTSAIAAAVAVQSDGKIVLGGGATISGHSDFAVARLNSDGTLDTSGFDAGGSQPGVTTFLASTYTSGFAWGEVVRPTDGEIFLGGQETNKNDFLAAAVNSDGSVHTAFGSSGMASILPGASTTGVVGTLFGLEPDNGELILGGNAQNTAACPHKNAPVLVRLDPSDGSIDTTFGNASPTNGFATNCNDTSAVNAMAIDSNDKLVVTGGDGYTLRFTEDGMPDSGFGTGGYVTHTQGSRWGANGVAIQPSDGNIVLAGAEQQMALGELEVSVSRLLG